MRAPVKALLALALVALLAASAGLPTATSRSSGINDVPNGCSCHDSDPAGGVSVTLAGLPENFTGGETYLLEVNITGGPAPGGSNQGGFNLAVSGGTLAPRDATTQLKGSQGSHTAAGNDQRDWSMNWTAPADDTLTVEFTLTGNAVDGDGANNPADQWNRATYRVPGANAGGEGGSLGQMLWLGVLLLLTAVVLFGTRYLVLAPTPPAESLGRVWRALRPWLVTTDHKKIGLLYIGTGIFFLIVGGVLALLIRIQLVQPDNDFLSNASFNSAFTLHGTTMIFMAAMPIIFGFANYVVPLQIGARDLAFPRLNALSYWLLPTGALVVYAGYLVGGASDVGWTGYVPYSTTEGGSARPGTDLWIAGQILLGASSTMTAVNFTTTILRFRAPGVSLMRMPLFTWSILVSVAILLLAIPVFTVALALLFLDRNVGTLFFDPAVGGDPVLWEHLFWYFGHPEVYVVILPAFGVLSEVIATMARRPIYGYRSMVYAMGGIGFIGFVVWGHHMFTSGADPRFRLATMLLTMLVAIPTGIKIFNWLATLNGGQWVRNSAMLFALGTIFTFTLGGITGIYLASIPLNTQLHDTYFVVGHFHYVLVGGVVFAFFSGIYYWYPKMMGRYCDERLGLLHFLFTFIGFHITFYPMHELGIMGMPRRVATYSVQEWADLNLYATVGAFILAFGQLFLVYNLVWSYFRGREAGDDPWGGWSLEWTTSSPPPPHSFDEQPVLRDAEMETAEAPEDEGGDGTGGSVSEANDAPPAADEGASSEGAT